MRLISSPKRPSLVAFILFSWAVAGCSSPAATFCNAKCDCEGNCSTNARATCTQTGEDNERIAHDVGCGAQVDAFSSCENSLSKCVAGKYNTGACDPEFSKLTQCLLSEGCGLGLDLRIHCL